MPKREKISGSGRIIELETENMVPRVDAIQKSILDFGQKSVLARNRFWPEIDFVGWGPTNPKISPGRAIGLRNRFFRFFSKIDFSSPLYYFSPSCLS